MFLIFETPASSGTLPVAPMSILLHICLTEYKRQSVALPNVYGESQRDVRNPQQVVERQPQEHDLGYTRQ